jgi:hypothetical protein
VKEIFNNFGNIHSCGIRRNDKKYAVVNYNSKEEAEQATNYMNNGYVDGLTISVKLENITN